MNELFDGSESRRPGVCRGPRRLGIVGGVGPDATAWFYRQVVARYRELFLGDTPDVIVHSLPLTAESETAFVTGRVGTAQERSMVEALYESLRLVAAAGADLVAVPCNTLHDYLPGLADRLGLPFVDIVSATLARLQAVGARRFGLLATTSTLHSGLYQRHAAAAGMTVATPPAAAQRGIALAIDALLHDPDEPSAGTVLGAAAERLAEGADAVVLGCTDLWRSPLPRLPVPVVDSLQCLVEAVCLELEGEPSVIPDVGRLGLRP